MYSQVQQRSAELQIFLEAHWPGISARSDSKGEWRSDKAVIERARNYVARIPGAVSGNGGHNATFHVACVLVKGFALTESQSLSLITAWNTRCEPPWTEQELVHKISDAAKAPGESGYLRNTKPDRWPSIRIPEHHQRIDSGRAAPLAMVSTFQRTYDETDRNDMGNAAHLSHVYRDELRFCAEWEKWLFWDGARWKLDDERRVLKVAKQVTRSMFSDAMENLKSDIMNHTRKTASAPRLKAMIELAAPDLPIRVSEMDQHPWILNCPNGALDLRTGHLFPHDRSMNITALSPTEYYHDAESPVWSKFLSDVFVEPELIQFMQRLFGMSWLSFFRSRVSIIKPLPPCWILPRAGIC